jgi:hypothetical protein
MEHEAEGGAGLTADQELAELRELVAGLTWRVARTIPQWPHSYIVRGRTADEAVFLRLFRAIKAYGQDQKFGPFRNRYLHLGDGSKYWAMDKDEADATIINRDQALDPTTFKRVETPGVSRPPGGHRGRRPPAG